MLAPEITMREEPGEIRIHQHSGEVAVEIDDEEPPTMGQQQHLGYGSGGIPPEISITRVNKQPSSMMHHHQNRPFLKVRNDLSAGGPPGLRPVQVRPPPLLRAGGPRPSLPPLPRLRFGGPSRHSSQMPARIQQQQQNPLVGMFNMMPPMNPNFSMQHHLPHPMNGGGIRGVSSNASLLRQQRFPTKRQQPPQHPRYSSPSVPFQKPIRTHNSGGMPSMIRPSSNRSVPGVRNLTPLPLSHPQHHHHHHHQRPSPSNRVHINKPPAVCVPPPMTVENGGGESHNNSSRFPELNITVKSVPKTPKTPVVEDMEEEEEIDDEEEEEVTEELDDVEPELPPVGGASQTGMMASPPASAATHNGKLSSPIRFDRQQQHQQQSKRSRKVSTLQFVRRADGKGFMRKPIVGSSLLKNKKKKRRFFRGANYRFDGTSIKKRPGRKCTANDDASEELSITVKEVPTRSKQEPDVLAYLGIQRKDATGYTTTTTTDSSIKMAPQQKAKKSFRPGAARLPSTDDNTVSVPPATAHDSLTIRKRHVDVHDSSKSFLNKKPKGGSPPSQQYQGSSLGNHFLSDTAIIDARPPQTEEKPMPRTRPKEVKTDLEEAATAKLQQCICECNKDASEAAVLTKKPGVTYNCQAIETVGGSRVGCHNKISDFCQRRSSTKLSQQLFCNEHIQRLKAHQSCAFCGEFCAHGLFLMCRPIHKAEPHLFHKLCYTKDASKKCPHCHSADKPMSVSLKLSMSRMPLNLLQTVSKMSLVKGKKTTKRSDSILTGNNVVTYKMPNGKIITSEGLPDGLTDSVLEKVIAAVEDKEKLKHITRNMYTPTKAGDAVKLLQLLSLGYSPQQRFTEAEGGSPLHVAAAEGHVLTAHILIQAGAELDVNDDEQNTPLMLACIKGKPDMVKYLLQAGADFTLRGDDGMTCLHFATQNGHLECVHMVLNQKNLPRKFINVQDEGGWTPLVWACENKHEDVINYLLEHGANPLITDAEGNIALHWAALSGSRSTCEVLLNAGCDINATNSIGETPMHIVLRQDHYECAILLLMRKVRLDLQNKNGQIPVECMVGKTPLCATIVKLSTTLHSLMKDTTTNRLERIVTNDLTRGKEANPIQCVNDLDDEGEPTDYVYVKQNCVTTSVPVDRNISTLQHCKCRDTCSSEDSCNCSDLSVKSWYDLQGRLKEGFDFREPPMIFECNNMCHCHLSSCHNRVVQHGISVRLQVFRTEGMGWGCRALADIPKGTFVCEYVGEVISDSEAETREDSYLFDLDNRDGETFCIDANRYGNIARFINHSCAPNVVPVKVFASHQDLRFPHIALFANCDIPKGKELGFDYGEKFWVIKHKFFTCHCGSEKCRYNRNNIQSFLREYYKKSAEDPQDLQSHSSEILKTTDDDLCKVKTNDDDLCSKNSGQDNKIPLDTVNTNSPSLNNANGLPDGLANKSQELESPPAAVDQQKETFLDKSVEDGKKIIDSVGTTGTTTRPRRAAARKRDEDKS